MSHFLQALTRSILRGYKFMKQLQVRYKSVVFSWQVFKKADETIIFYIKISDCKYHVPLSYAVKSRILKKTVTCSVSKTQSRSYDVIFIIQWYFGWRFSLTFTQKCLKWSVCFSSIIEERYTYTCIRKRL